MLNLESNKVNVEQSASTVFDFLSDLNNLEKLMPEGKVEKWNSTTDSCRFGIKNLATIGMKIKETNSPSLIVLESDGKNPFDFTLTIHIADNGATAESYIAFEGDVNMFMTAMVKKPLGDFFNVLANNLTKIW